MKQIKNLLLILLCIIVILYLGPMIIFALVGLPAWFIGVYAILGLAGILAVIYFYISGNSSNTSESGEKKSTATSSDDKKIPQTTKKINDHWIIRALQSKPMQIIWKVLVAILIIYFLHWVFTGHWSLNGGFFPKAWETLTGQSPEQISEKAKIKAEKEIRLEELRNQENDKRRAEREAMREHRRERWSNWWNGNGNNESTNSSYDENSNSESGSGYQNQNPRKNEPVVWEKPLQGSSESSTYKEMSQEEQARSFSQPQ